MPISLIKRFIQLESSGGIVLLVSTVLAMIVANTRFSDLHQQFIDQFLFIINDGLMALFFLVVGLELKRGFLEGQFTPFSKVALPLIAAIGGMIVPALVYILVCFPDQTALKGWATPVATDIAFALGVLSLLGKRVPAALKLFLMALAIFDDIGAILIITIFHADNLSLSCLLLSVGILTVLVLLNVLSVKSLTLYSILGGLLWMTVFNSGIHPTIAGVLFALTLPDNVDKNVSVMQRMENGLHPWVAYLIMPLFAFANAGFSFAGLSLDIVWDHVVLGITLGLLLGKQLGVFLFSWAVIRLKWAKLPEKTHWLQLYGVSLLCGIGFTMSLFLGTLSFSADNTYLLEVRLGVILGSLLSGLFGAMVLFYSLMKE